MGRVSFAPFTRTTEFGMKTKLSQLRFLRRCHPLLALAAATVLTHMPLLGSIDDGLIAYYPFTGNANDAREIQGVR